jgi:hypothetical protein
VTTFETTEGVVELIDFMPPGDGASSLVRLVRGVRGSVALHTEFALRFDYGSVVPWVQRLDEDGALSAIAGPARLCCPRRYHFTAGISSRMASSPSEPTTWCHSF